MQNIQLSKLLNFYKKKKTEIKTKIELNTTNNFPQVSVRRKYILKLIYIHIKGYLGV